MTNNEENQKDGNERVPRRKRNVQDGNAGKGHEVDKQHELGKRPVQRQVVGPTEQAEEVELPKLKLGDHVFMRDNDDSVVTAQIIAVEKDGFCVIYHRLSTLGKMPYRRNLKLGFGKSDLWPNLEEMQQAVKLERAGISASR